jgi:hypothetical protein
MTASPTKSDHIVVRLKPETHARLKAVAAADDRAISAMARLLLERALADLESTKTGAAD